MERSDSQSSAELLRTTKYTAGRHAAVRTKDFIFSQLIPYIGNKRKLLPLIAQGLLHVDCREGTFVDLFSGSTVVSRFAKSLGFRTVANDWEPYAYQIAHATIGLNSVPAFADLGGATNVFDSLNGLPPLHGYISEHLCPSDDENPDPEHERMFFTKQNGEQIDAIREQLVEWEQSGKLSADELAFLLSSLVYAVSYVSNTSGVFKGFHRGWGGTTGTALYRIRSRLHLTPPQVLDNGKHNIALREDALRLSQNLSQRIGGPADIVYLDPPYNQHPYGSNYHVLNTVVLWDKPQVNPDIRVDGKVYDKSAIRKDWRTERRSAYNLATSALSTLTATLDALSAPNILMSYSTDGNIPLQRLIQSLAERGRLHVFTRKYKRYRVSTPRMSPKSHNIEFLAVLNTQQRNSLSHVDQIVAELLRTEQTFTDRTSHSHVRQLGLF